MDVLFHLSSVPPVAGGGVRSRRNYRVRVFGMWREIGMISLTAEQREELIREPISR
jgi:hypothetical protein